MSRFARDKAKPARQLGFAVAVGACVGIVFALIGGVLALLQGTEELKTEGLTMARLMVMYVGGGVAGGAIVGLLLPLAKRSVLAAMVVGYVAISPYMLAIAFAVTRESTVSPFQIVPITSLAGALAGWFIWRAERPSAGRRRRRSATRER